MDRKEFESAAVRVTYLRGLIGLPVGLLFVLIGLGNLRWGPFVHAWVFVTSLAVIGGSALVIKRYYDNNYGRVVLFKQQQLKYSIISSVIIAGAVIGGPIVDFSFALPVSVFTISFALGALAWFKICVGLRAHHLIIWGSLLLAGVLPVWGSVSDKVSVAWLPIGGATLLAGLFDHRALVRAYGGAQGLSLEKHNVGA